MAPEKTLTVDEAIQAVTAWVMYRDRHEGDWRMGVADPSHSSLLQRLLSGEEPLPHPPIRSFSYPNIELTLHGGRVEASFGADRGVTDWAVCVDQCTAWDLVERDGDSALIRWRASGNTYRLTPLAESDGFHTHELLPTNSKSEDSDG